MPSEERLRAVSSREDATYHTNDTRARRYHVEFSFTRKRKKSVKFMCIYIYVYISLSEKRKKALHRRFPQADIIKRLPSNNEPSPTCLVSRDGDY